MLEIQEFYANKSSVYPDLTIQLPTIVFATNFVTTQIKNNAMSIGV